MQILSIARAFPIHGSPVSYIQFGQGHINTTYKVETDCGNAYILQQINQFVFRQPEKLMENAFAVTKYLKNQPDVNTVLDFLPTVNGQLCYQDAHGEYWRMYHYIPGKTMELVKKAEDLYRCGLGFGKFQMLLADFPADSLHETIPNFHNTIDRYCQFHDSISANAAGRKQEVQEEINYLLYMEDRAGALQRKLEAGILPLRVTHNDTKLSNLLFNAEDQPICVLDLDTVMPGLSAMDFADAIRTGAATAAEDEPDVSKMGLNLQYFQAFTRGFLEGATTLTAEEVHSLAEGALIITLEQAVRFLKDYLDGDIYYHIAYPTHNLVRARTQIKLAQDMVLKMQAMQDIVLSIKEGENSSCY